MALFNWDHRDGVATIHLNHAPLNTLTIEMMQDLTKVVRNMAAAPSGVRPRAIVLASSVAGQFSQGVEPRAIVDGSMEDRKKIFLALGDLVEAFWFSYIPVIADVCGPAVAGGAVLAMLGDFVIMSASHSKICFSEVKVGLPVPAFIQRLVRAKTSPAYWTEILLLGKNVNAIEATRMGIANGVYHDDEERNALLGQLLSKITRLSPDVLSETLRQARVGEKVWLDAFRSDIGAFAHYLTEDYCVKALRSVMAGDAPKF